MSKERVRKVRKARKCSTQMKAESEHYHQVMAQSYPGPKVMESAAVNPVVTCKRFVGANGWRCHTPANAYPDHTGPSKVAAMAGHGGVGWGSEMMDGAGQEGLDQQQLLKNPIHLFWPRPAQWLPMELCQQKSWYRSKETHYWPGGLWRGKLPLPGRLVAPPPTIACSKCFFSSTVFCGLAGDRTGLWIRFHQINSPAKKLHETEVLPERSIWCLEKWGTPVFWAHQTVLCSYLIVKMPSASCLFFCLWNLNWPSQERNIICLNVKLKEIDFGRALWGRHFSPISIMDLAGAAIFNQDTPLGHRILILKFSEKLEMPLFVCLAWKQNVPLWALLRKGLSSSGFLGREKTTPLQDYFEPPFERGQESFLFLFPSRLLRLLPVPHKVNSVCVCFSTAPCTTQETRRLFPPAETGGTQQQFSYLCMVCLACKGPLSPRAQS